MTQHTFKYFGFERQGQEAISAILDLADSALSSAWLVTEDDGYDVAMIAWNAENGPELLAAQTQRLPGYRIILVAENPQSELAGHWFLGKKTHAPPSLKELTKLLNEISVLLAEAQAAAGQTPEESASVPPTSAEASEKESEDTVASSDAPADTETPALVTDPDAALASGEIPARPQTKTKMLRPLLAKNYFFGHLLQAQKDKACRILSFRQLPDLYLAPSDNACYFQGSDGELVEYFSARPQYLKETVVSKQKLQTVLTREQIVHKQPLDALIANAVLYVSEGRLPDGHSAEQTVKLAAMPDFARLPMLSPYRRIAEFAFQKPGSLFQYAEALKTPLSSIYDFYTVCFLLGYFEATSASQQKPEAATAEAKKTAKLSEFLKDFFNKKIL